jgi:glutathione S-transferase
MSQPAGGSGDRIACGRHRAHRRARHAQSALARFAYLIPRRIGHAFAKQEGTLMPVLHQMQMSGNCYKVRLTAALLDIPLTLKEYPLHGGDTRKPAFLALNPNGRVPLLEFEDGRTLAESGAIIFHLSDGTHLQPEDKWARAQMLNWMFFEQYSHEPYIAVARFWLRYAPEAELEKRRHLVSEWHERGNAALAVMETHLSRHQWFAGERYSIADIALYGYTHCAGEGDFSLSSFPAVSSWLGRVASRSGHIALGKSR